MSVENLKPRRLEIGISHAGGEREWFSMLIKGQRKSNFSLDTPLKKCFQVWKWHCNLQEP